MKYIKDNICILLLLIMLVAVVAVRILDVNNMGQEPKLQSKDIIKIGVEINSGEKDIIFEVIEKENINNLVKAFSLLEEGINSQLETWYSTVKIEIFHQDGHVEKCKYNKIKGYEEVFDEVIQSKEVRYQLEPIFNLEKENISSVEIFNIDTRKNIIVENIDILGSLLNTLKEYEKVYDNDDETDIALAGITIYDLYQNAIYVVLHRKDINTLNLLKEYKLYEEIVITNKDISNMEIVKNEEIISIDDSRIIDLILATYVGFTTPEDGIEISFDIVDVNGKVKTIFGRIYNKNVPKEIDELFDRSKM